MLFPLCRFTFGFVCLGFFFLQCKHTFFFFFFFFPLKKLKKMFFFTFCCIFFDDLGLVILSQQPDSTCAMFMSERILLDSLLHISWSSPWLFSPLSHSRHPCRPSGAATLCIPVKTTTTHISDYGNSSSLCFVCENDDSSIKHVSHTLLLKCGTHTLRQWDWISAFCVCEFI